jgi:serine/threonine protein kinase
MRTRNLQPENILLGAKAIVKISGFGEATVFRSKDGVEKMVSRGCSYRAFMPPEVLLIC